MLNFSKISIFFIYLTFFLISIFTILNFQNDDNKFIDKKVNLGLDLQGGSYLLLEIDSEPLIKERIQAKVIPLKKFLKENNLNYKNFIIKNASIIFEINNLEKFKNLFLKKQNNEINPYID